MYPCWQAKLNNVSSRECNGEFTSISLVSIRSITVCILPLATALNKANFSAVVERLLNSFVATLSLAFKAAFVTTFGSVLFNLFLTVGSIDLHFKHTARTTNNNIPTVYQLNIDFQHFFSLLFFCARGRSWRVFVTFFGRFWTFFFFFFCRDTACVSSSMPSLIFLCFNFKDFFFLFVSLFFACNNLFFSLFFSEFAFCCSIVLATSSAWRCATSANPSTCASSLLSRSSCSFFSRKSLSSFSFFNWTRSYLSFSFFRFLKSTWRRWVTVANVCSTLLQSSVKISARHMGQFGCSFLSCLRTIHSCKHSEW